MVMTTASIWVDGAARGNPGPASIAALIKDDTGAVHATISRSIGKATNNQAEYQAVIAALEKAVSLGTRNIKLHSDSELVVRQITGRYRVKNVQLKPLHARVKELQERFHDFRVQHIPRSQNREADALANQALDSDPA